MSLLDQSGVTGGGLEPYNVHALSVNIDKMSTERFGNYDCLVLWSIGLVHMESMDRFVKDNQLVWFNGPPKPPQNKNELGTCLSVS